jgi:hypothetical protein
MKNSLSDNLRRSLGENDGSDISLKRILENVDEQGFGLLLMVLSLPSALPIPAAGYSTPFGILFIVLGIQMLIGRHRPWLPEWAARRTMTRSFAEKAIGMATRWLGHIERLVHPRLKWISSPFGSRFLSFVVVVMAALMTLPIPTTNTFPAAVIFLIGVGLSEKDGLFCLGACAVGVLAIALYSVIIYILITQGMEGVLQFKEWIKGLLGMGEAG